MSRRRPKTWTLEEAADGTITVVRSGRTMQSKVTMDWARRFVRRNREDDEEVFHEEPDGYRRNITRSL